MVKRYLALLFLFQLYLCGWRGELKGLCMPHGTPSHHLFSLPYFFSQGNLLSFEWIEHNMMVEAGDSKKKALCEVLGQNSLYELLFYLCVHCTFEHVCVYVERGLDPCTCLCSYLWDYAFYIVVYVFAWIYVSIHVYVCAHKHTTCLFACSDVFHPIFPLGSYPLPVSCFCYKVNHARRPERPSDLPSYI